MLISPCSQPPCPGEHLALLWFSRPPCSRQGRGERWPGVSHAGSSYQVVSESRKGPLRGLEGLAEGARHLLADIQHQGGFASAVEQSLGPLQRQRPPEGGPPPTAKDFVSQFWLGTRPTLSTSLAWCQAASRWVSAKPLSWRGHALRQLKQQKHAGTSHKHVNNWHS